MNGGLLIDKAAGLTSHDVVGKVRHILHQRRVGHTGTLDPFATGLLVILVGQSTRLAQFVSGMEKEYEAVIRLGYRTDTGDLTGQRLEPESQYNNGPWTEAQIEEAMSTLRGEIDQIPPMYSAKKQGGRRLYELARQGQEVAREPVQVGINAFEPIWSAGELLKENHDGTFDLKARVACTAGTYVRTLAEDFGRLLQTGAHLVELRRTRVGDYLVAQAQTLADLKTAVAEESLGQVLRMPDELLAAFAAVDLTPDDLKRVLNGLDIRVNEQVWTDGERVRMRDSNGQLVAVGIFNAANQVLHPSIVFAEVNQ